MNGEAELAGQGGRRRVEVLPTLGGMVGDDLDVLGAERTWEPTGGRRWSQVSPDRTAVVRPQPEKGLTAWQ